MAAASFVAVPAFADAVQPPPEPEAPVRWGDSEIRIMPMVTLQNSGYFRFRFNLFHQLDLGLGSDPTLNPRYAPATSDSVGAKASLGNVSTTAATANLRLRWEPALRIAELVSVRTVIDFLDNVVMGETPSYDSIAGPMSIFAGAARPPAAGFSAFRDSVRIKAAWAELRLFDLIVVRGGRIPQHFGLGIVRNAGRDPDSDFGDYVDGVFGKVKIGITYIQLGMEFPGEGVSSDSPYGYSTRPYDMDQSDDATRWVFGVDSSPETVADREEARKTLDEGKPLVDWGWYNAITQQKISSERIVSAAGGQLPEQPLAGSAYDDYTTVPRDAFFWTPSIWTRILWKPQADMKLRVEFEGAAVYGWVNHVQSNREDPKSRKEFLQFGGALEAEFDWGLNRVGLLTGAASGGNTLGAWGILDRHVLNSPNQTGWNPDRPEVFRTTNIHHFVFNRDYRVDSILFREVIGSVTNAFYFKPFYGRTFMQSGAWSLGGGVSLLAAFASIPEGAPGGKRPLGLEPGLDLWLRWGDNLSVRADGAVLFPLGGLDRSSTGQEAEPAGALRIRAVVGF